MEQAVAVLGKGRGVLDRIVDAQADGADTKLRTAITELGLTYAAGVQPHTSVRRPGEGPLPPKPPSGRGRPTSQRRRDAEHQPTKVKDLAMALRASAWETVTWREGSVGQLTSRFARLRVTAAHRDEKLKESRPEEWLLVEWPEDEEQPTKYWLSTLPESISFADLVDATKLRWRIERDYQDLKQEVGLGHYEGRGWRGFHHHATLCIAAYGVLISERGAFPPQDGSKPANSSRLSFPRVDDPTLPPLRPERHVTNAIATMRRRLTVAPRQDAQPMSMLPRAAP